MTINYDDEFFLADKVSVVGKIEDISAQPEYKERQTVIFGKVVLSFRIIIDSFIKQFEFETEIKAYSPKYSGTDKGMFSKTHEELEEYFNKLKEDAKVNLYKEADSLRQKFVDAMNKK
jgi:hypothetical protein